jgi:hypothetical protein
MRLLRASFIICLILLSAFLPSIGHSADVQEPQDIYLYRIDDYDPTVAWNKVKETPELAELASYGNYSVLSAFVAYGTEGDRLPAYGDNFVIASTLQPDSEGLVHQLIVRYRRDNIEVFEGSVRVGWNWSLTHIETYVETHTFNPMTDEEAESKADDFLCGCFDPWEGVRSRVSDYPFLILRRIWITPPFPAYTVSVIMNQLTGKILIVCEASNSGIPEWGWSGVLSRNPDINPMSDILSVNFRATVSTLQEAYGAKPGDRWWCLYFDANRDDTIDIYDAVIFAKNR